MDPTVELLGQSEAIEATRETIRRFLRRQQTTRRLPAVLIHGETGTGKNLVSRFLHRHGPRARGPFVDVNCAAIPETLLESELFGYERGAFTDARRAKAGLFQTAHLGTIFLDEVGLLPEALQAKLLTVLEERTVRRLGGTHAEPADAWVISATNSDLQEAIRERRFREDLYHRLAVLTLRMPSLHERGTDVLLLAEHFLTRMCADYSLGPKTLAADARDRLMAYRWPGNVRELSNVIERAALLAEGTTVTADDLALGTEPERRATADAAPGAAGPTPAAPVSLDDAMREHLRAALQTTGANIANASTEGYSRQQVDLATAGGQYTGAGFFGQGVRIETVTRAADAFLTREAAASRARAAFDETRLEQLTQLEKVFPSGEQGIGYAAGQLLNAFVDVVNRPQDTSARQVVLARTEELAARFRAAGEQIDVLQAGVVEDLRNTVATVNSLAQQVAGINQQIAAAHGSGHVPNDLLDQRDLLISQISEHIQVTTIPADDGTMGVFIGGGQRLVLSNSALPLKVVADQYDPARMRLAIGEVGGDRLVPAESLAGGSIAGLLRFQNDDLADARALLGQLASAITGRLNEQQALGLDLRQPPGTGAPLLATGAPRVLPATSNDRLADGTFAASVSLTVTDTRQLQASDYELRADPATPGQYLLERLSDGVTRTVLPGDEVDGFRIDVGVPAPGAGDRFLLQPVSNAASGMARVLDDPREALRLGYRFDSYRDRYEAMFAVLRERLGLPQTNVEQWLDLNAEARRPWIEKADLRASAALLLVEQAALRRHLLLAQEELKNRYLSGRERGDATLAKADETLQGILANSGFLSQPAQLLDGQGYGLPQASEWQRLEQESSQRQARLSQLTEALDQEVRLLLGEERRLELESVEANLTQIGAHLRRLHKASGGFVLP